MYRTINKLLENNSWKDRAWPGHPCSVHTKKRIQLICEKVQRNPQCSANKMTAEEYASRRTMEDILN